MTRRAIRDPREERYANALWALWIATLLYLFVAFTRYQYAHPEQTRTQLTLNAWQAITWQ